MKKKPSSSKRAAAPTRGRPPKKDVEAKKQAIKTKRASQAASAITLLTEGMRDSQHATLST